MALLEYNTQQQLIDETLKNSLVSSDTQNNNYDDANNNDFKCMDNELCRNYIGACTGSPDSIEGCIEWFNKPENDLNKLEPVITLSGTAIKNFINTLKWPMAVVKMAGYRRSSKNIAYGKLLSGLNTLYALAKSNSTSAESIIDMTKSDISAIDDNDAKPFKEYVESLSSSDFYSPVLV
jgi:hypothetical protein